MKRRLAIVVANVLLSASCFAFTDNKRQVGPSDNRLFLPGKMKSNCNQGSMKVEAGKRFRGMDCLCVEGPTNRCHTAWRVISHQIAVPAGSRAFVLQFRVYSEKRYWAMRKFKVGGYNNSIVWYGDDRSHNIGVEPLRFAIPRGDFSQIEVTGPVPSDARFALIQFGCESPDMRPGETIAFADATLEFFQEEKSSRIVASEKIRPLPAPPVPSRTFKVDRMPETPMVTLRDDGMTLIDGRPFFPIGIYGLAKFPANSNSFDVALKQLKDAGFNFVQSYTSYEDQEFLAAVRKHGMKTWMWTRWPDKKRIEDFRFNPDILAWYIGDDTSRFAPPEEVLAFHHALKSIDPTRLTCQADIVEPCFLNDRYADYVQCADVYMPEVYGVRDDAGDQSDYICAAWTIKAMKDVARDVKLHAGGVPKGCWPILQCFKGWNHWGHYPSKQQMLACAFAAIIHGANGITWYTYGTKNPKYEAMMSSPEKFAEMAEIATMVKSLSPVLLERTPKCQPIVNVVSGPAKDAYGNASISVLLKRRCGVSYLMAVNSSARRVEADINIPDVGDKVGDVVGENRKVVLDGDAVNDVFEPLAVHVYKFIDRP